MMREGRIGRDEINRLLASKAVTEFARDVKGHETDRRHAHEEAAIRVFARHAHQRAGFAGHGGRGSDGAGGLLGVFRQFHFQTAKPNDSST
jgi:hypothetical protein